MPMDGPPDEPHWLLWGRELQALAQTGLTFSQGCLRSGALPAPARHGHRRCWRPAPARPSSASARCSSRSQGYPTPKVDVRGAVFREDRILLVREVSDGRWTLPGGWADVNQSARQCVEREISEESGFQARRSSWPRCRTRGGRAIPQPSLHLQVLLRVRADGRRAREPGDQRGGLLSCRGSAAAVARSHHRARSRACLRISATAT